MWRRVLALVGALLVLPLFVLWLLVAQPWPVWGHPAARAVEPERLRAHVQALAVDCFPRAVPWPERLALAAAYVSNQLARAGAVTAQAYEAQGRTYYNYIASFGPSAGPRLVVGAHYDSCADTPGADDNASGVAVLLELASALARTPPARRVDLVAFCTEEPPYFATDDMGSVHHARRLRDEGAAVAGVLVLEMVGCFRDEPGSQGYPVPALRLFYPGRGNFLAVVGRWGEGAFTRQVRNRLRATAALPVHSVNCPTLVPGVDFSDHRSYWAAGFPAVMLTDTAFYRNPNYHTPRDRPDALDYGRMADVATALLAALSAWP